MPDTWRSYDGFMRAAVILSFAIGCQPTIILPPPVPAQVMPPLPTAPPQSGKGQVQIATDEPALVEQVIGHTAGFADDGTGTIVAFDDPVYQTVCAATPCATSLDLGPHDLRITSTVNANHYGTGSITVGAQPIDYSYALGHNNIDPHFASGLGATVAGGTAFMSGLFMYGFTQQPNHGLAPTSTWGSVGIGVLLVGAVLTLIGVHFLEDGGQAQEGTGVQWTP